MLIKDLVTPEQYTQLKKEYAVLVKNKEITFLQFCTNTYKLKTKTKGVRFPLLLILKLRRF